MWRSCFVTILVLTTAQLAACQPRATPNIEATVQVRVAATVAALQEASEFATPTPALASSPAPAESALPYTFQQENFRITLLDVGPYPEPRYPPPGYRFVAARIWFENLSDRDHSPRRCVGFADLRLRTDQDNTYGPSGGGYELFSRLRPGAELRSQVAFRILEDEQPVELWVWRHGEGGPTADCNWTPRPEDPPELVFALEPSA